MEVVASPLNSPQARMRRESKLNVSLKKMQTPVSEVDSDRAWTKYTTAENAAFSANRRSGVRAEEWS